MQFNLHCRALPRVQSGGDVYIYEREPLKAGEQKHVISVFVADESGLINRVAGVFARRGAPRRSERPRSSSCPFPQGEPEVAARPGHC